MYTSKKNYQVHSFLKWDLNSPSGNNNITETTENTGTEIPQNVKDEIAHILDDNEVTKEEITRLFEDMVKVEVFEKPDIFRKVLLQLYRQRDEKLKTTLPRERIKLLEDFSRTVTEMTLRHAQAISASTYELAIQGLHKSYEQKELNTENTINRRLQKIGEQTGH